MRTYRENDYDEMAGRCVDRFLRGETKLADAAVHEAMNGQLNPDQIERLVQAANTMAFLRMMESRKAEGAPDMTHEFDPVDTSHVLQQIIGQTPMSGGMDASMDPSASGGHPDLGLLGGDHGGAPNGPPGLPGMPGMDMGAGPGDEGPLPDEHNPERDGDGDGKTDDDEDGDDDDNDGPFPKGKKQKAKDDVDKKEKKAPPSAPQKDEKKEAAVRYRRMRKLAELLEDQFTQAELAFEDEFAQLETVLKQAHGGPSWDAFEKNALALHGDEFGALVLNMTRQTRRLDPLPVDDIRTKHAALADHHLVDDNDKATNIFDRLVKIAAQADRVRRAAEHARAQCV